MGDAERIGAAVLRERLEVELALAGAGAHADLNLMDSPPLRIRQAIEILDLGVNTPWSALRGNKPRGTQHGGESGSPARGLDELGSAGGRGVPGEGNLERPEPVLAGRAR